MRDFLNSVLSAIGAESLTDVEFDSILATIVGYNQETYDALSSILEGRDAVSDTQERLRYHYIENGFNVALEGTGKSNIFLGGVLGDLSGLPINSSLNSGAVTPARALMSDAIGNPVASLVTSTELSYLSGATSNIQDQIDGIEIGEPGAGAEIVESGTYASPNLISTAIAAPTNLKQRTFISGASAPVVDPTLGDGTDTYELFLFGCNDTNTVELNSTTNLLLSGPIILKLGTILTLHWIAGLDKWVEVTRNEI